MPEHEDVAPEPPVRVENEFDLDDEAGDEALGRRAIDRAMNRVARQGSLDPDDGIEL